MNFYTVVLKTQIIELKWWDWRREAIAKEFIEAVEQKG
jgi:hypothetical protein